jgi:hypothetical protein
MQEQGNTNCTKMNTTQTIIENTNKQGIIKFFNTKDVKGLIGVEKNLERMYSKCTAREERQNIMNLLLDCENMIDFLKN